MDWLRDSLVTLFKEQSACKILSNYYHYASYHRNNHESVNDREFINVYQQLNKQLNRDEIVNLYHMTTEKMKMDERYSRLDKSVFNLLLNYTKSMLRYDGRIIKCRYQDLLKWRMTTLKIDQDILVSAFLAMKDIHVGIKRDIFDWAIIIKSDNTRLHNLLSQGMAENHFHLKGSAPTFNLSFTGLMNDLSISKVYKVDDGVSRLGKDIDDDIPMSSAITVAALIRLILFTTMIEDRPILSRLENILRLIVENKITDEYTSMYIGEIQETINAYRFTMLTSRTTDRWDRVDYADIRIHNQDRATRHFAGERYLMYTCFKKLYEGNQEMLKYADLFYVYIVLKNTIRGELIQQNEQVGFSNFKDYQDRKTIALSNGILKRAVEPTAILSSVKSQNVESIEARIVPSRDYSDMVRQIEDMDNRITLEVLRDHENCWVDRSYISEAERRDLEYPLLSKNEKIIRKQEELKEKYFYVYHYPKRPDSLAGCQDKTILSAATRHEGYRRELKRASLNLCDIRVRHPRLASRILGIDACSDELVTRSEVYGQAFRCLKGHIPNWEYHRLYTDGYHIPLLKATYHVGEEFLDVIDGLRAIDEAIIFLELTHGDRLGHAIALGIDVRDWYTQKCNRVCLAQQDIIDNIAWLIHKIKKYHVPNGASIVNKLEELYYDYYARIYADAMRQVDDKDKIGLIPPDLYIKAWELRGDDPNAYISDEVGVTYWDRCGKRVSHDYLPEGVADLYIAYHYNAQVKLKGRTKDILKIEPYMIEATQHVQRAMQEEIRQRGIGIECNPSSNVLISNFGRYDKHPILQFNNAGLGVDEQNNPQLFASINTDDQGVFNTLLENEYALMGIALEKVKDQDGNYVYNQSNIYDWLDRIRRMGLEQSFRQHLYEKSVPIHYNL